MSWRLMVGAGVAVGSPAWAEAEHPMAVTKHAPATVIRPTLCTGALHFASDLNPLMTTPRRYAT